MPQEEPVITLPLKVLLQGVCDGWQSLWKDPELSKILEAHPLNGTLFKIEHTTAARGPTVLYYPIEAWHEEQADEVRRWNCIKAQYKDGIVPEQKKETESIPTVEEPPHPLILEAREAVTQKDFVKLHDIKVQMRRYGISYSKREFDLRELINKSR